MNSFTRLLLILLMVSANTSKAQYVDVQSAAIAKQDAKVLELEQMRAKWLGREFWIEPNPSASTRITFIAADVLDKFVDSDRKFVLSAATSFVVSGYFERYHNHETERYAKVTFKDGKVAFLRENIGFVYDPNIWPLFENIYKDGQRSDFKEYIFTQSPDQIRVAEQTAKRKAAAVAKAWKARGGVNIGMTPTQVRASNWGSPNKINRSTGTYGIHEQWVYGDGNYIYFRDGRVSSIQN